MAVKYVFVTGGVVSGLGKGITAASLGRLLKMRGYKVTMQKFDPYINLGVSDAQPKILYILLAEDGWLQKDLAEFCKISPASMTILLNNMEKKDLVKRKKTQLSNGKRAFQIYLTENGRKIAKKVHDEMEKLEELTLSDFSQEEKDQLFSLMDKVCHNLNDH